VEAIGKEADHVQVAALSRALKLNIQVAYLDGRGTVSFLSYVSPLYLKVFF
jgi:ubiquitin thioesterase protein OTUB1